MALTIVLASSHDCGVYGCTIKNEYGTDTTDFLLSVDSKTQYSRGNYVSNIYLIVLIAFCFAVLSDILLREDLEGTYLHKIYAQQQPLLNLCKSSLHVNICFYLI